MAIKITILILTLGICTYSSFASFVDTSGLIKTYIIKYTFDAPCPVIDISQALIKEDTCDKHLGFIRNIKVTGATSYQWVNDEGTAVSNSIDLENITGGKYKLIATNAGCITESNVFEIRNHNINIGQRYDSALGYNVPDVTYVLPDSGKQNGSIRIHSLTGTGNEEISVTWRDGQNKITATGMLLEKVGNGMYTVNLENVSGCKNTSESFLLPNWECKIGFDDTRLQITNAPCNKSIGGIKGILINNITGNITYQWLDSTNKVVATTLDLNNVRGGKYRLQFKDESRCDTLYTPYYNIQSPDAIEIDTMAVKIKPSQCIIPTGTIHNIKAINATAFEWRDATGNIISNELDPGNLHPGLYVLKASNINGCDVISDPFVLPVSTEMAPSSLFRIEQKAPRCDSANGFIKVFDFPDAQNYSFRWEASVQQRGTLSHTTELSSVPAGQYTLFAKNNKGCEQKIITVNFEPMPAPVIDSSALLVGNDFCEQGTGFITGLKLNRGTSPLNITWLDENNNVRGTNMDIKQLPKGNYELLVSDKMNCKVSSQYTIHDQYINFSKPQYSNITVPIYSSATFTVSNFQPGNYLLFDSAAATLPVQENLTGNFTTKPLSSNKTYYVQVKAGVCESEKAAIVVHVAEEPRIFVPTGFTPNRDGKNDLFKPGVYGFLQSYQFKVYDRWGTVVFHSNDLTQGWDGRYKGKELTTGVYAWSLTGKDIQGSNIQKQGTMVLIR